MTKGIRQDRNSPAAGSKDHGLQWAISRRGFLTVYADRMTCGDWTIPYAAIEDAVLTTARSPILRIPAKIVSVQTGDAMYHFGLNPWALWKTELPFPVRRTEETLRLSHFSAMVRVVLIALIAYSIWDWYTTP